MTKSRKLWLKLIAIVVLVSTIVSGTTGYFVKRMTGDTTTSPPARSLPSSAHFDHINAGKISLQSLNGTRSMEITPTVKLYDADIRCAVMPGTLPDQGPCLLLQDHSSVAMHSIMHANGDFHSVAEDTPGISIDMPAST